MGAGPAGLTLLHRMLVAGRGPMAVIDAPSAGADAHAIAWWSDRPLPFDHLARKTWDRVCFATPNRHQITSLGPYRYRVLDGAVLHANVRATALRAGIPWIEAQADAVESTVDGAIVRVGGETLRARHAFDSRFVLGQFDPAPGHVLMRQRFRGWLVRTADDAFDPELPTMMDFRFPQEDGVRFAYILPWGPREALVELVAFGGEDPLGPIEPWLRDVAGIAPADIGPAEAGVTPMASWPLPRRDGSVLRIGIAGGRLKPSTGFGFTRMVEDAEAIVRSLERHGHPFDLPRPSRAWRFMDATLLRVAARRPDIVARALATLFRGRDASHVLRFLDERAGLWDILRVGASMPLLPFAVAGAQEAAWRVWEPLKRIAP